MGSYTSTNTEEIDDEVEYIAFSEICPDVMSKAIETDRKRKETKKAFKSIFPPHMIAKTSNGFLEFVIFDSDDEAEIAEYVAAYTKVGVKMKVYPITKTSHTIQLWENL